MEERIIRRLMNTVKCTQCGQHYHGEDVKVVGRSNGLYYLNAYCKTCGKLFMVAVSVGGDMTSLFSDLTEEEANRFSSSARPSANDVLDMHAFLKTFDGNFNDLFGKQHVG